MSVKEIDKKIIESLLPHREPMLLIDKLVNIVPLKSATAIMVKKDGFMFKDTFPNQPARLSFNCRSIWTSSSSVNCTRY